MKLKLPKAVSGGGGALHHSTSQPTPLPHEQSINPNPRYQSPSTSSNTNTTTTTTTASRSRGNVLSRSLNLSMTTRQHPVQAAVHDEHIDMADTSIKDNDSITCMVSDTNVNVSHSEENKSRTLSPPPSQEQQQTAKPKLQKERCVICLSRKDPASLFVLAPCQHDNICESCVLKLQTTACPTCRQEVSMIMSKQTGVQRSLAAIECEVRMRDEQAYMATVQVLMIGDAKIGKRSLIKTIKRLYPVNGKQPMLPILLKKDEEAAPRVATASIVNPPSSNSAKPKSVNANASSSSALAPDDGNNASNNIISNINPVIVASRVSATGSIRSGHSKRSNRSRNNQNNNNGNNDDGSSLAWQTESAFEEIHIQELEGDGCNNLDANLTLYGSSSKYSPNIICNGVPLRIKSINVPSSPSNSDVLCLLEDFESLKPDVIVFCSSFHSKSSFRHLVRWDTIIQRCVQIPRLWNFIRCPKFDPLNSGGVDIHEDIPLAIQAIRDLDNRPRSFFITCPAGILKNDISKFMLCCLRYGTRRPGLTSIHRGPRTWNDRFKYWWDVAVERSTGEPLALEEAEMIRENGIRRHETRSNRH